MISLFCCCQRKGWFNGVKKYMEDTDAVEGCRIKNGGCFGQTLLKREPVLQMDIHVPFGEDIQF